MSRTVPLVDLGRQHSKLRAEIDAAIAGVVDSGRFILGPEVTAFEEELATACESGYAVGVASGTDALLISLMALGVGAGDEVVTTAFSFFATAGVIARLGARPVFADIEEHSFNLDPAAALTQVSDKTRAIMPVNLYGRLATLPETDLPILEDAAQSIGTGKTRGLAASYSFFPTKNIGALGDAGAVVTNDADFADTLKLLRTHGGRPKYFHKVVGGNFRIDALQAAVLRVKLRHLAEWSEARRQNAARYQKLFAASSVPAELRLPEDSPEHVYHQFTIRVPRRDELRSALKAQGIATEIYYPHPLHLQECFSDLGYKVGSLPNTESAAAESLSLPIHPDLDADDQSYVVEKIAGFYQ
jgi:dTDP-4-amino-4,6-dideoxygalactose transaminase